MKLGMEPDAGGSRWELRWGIRMADGLEADSVRTGGLAGLQRAPNGKTGASSSGRSSWRQAAWGARLLEGRADPSAAGKPDGTAPRMPAQGGALGGV